MARWLLLGLGIVSLAGAVCAAVAPPPTAAKARAKVPPKKSQAAPKVKPKDGGSSLVIVIGAGGALTPSPAYYLPGASVVWFNADTVAHSAATNGELDLSGFSFDTGAIPPGQFSQPVTMPAGQAVTHAYYDRLNNNLNGGLLYPGPAPTGTRKATQRTPARR
jgi:hypothetical protein